MKLGRVDVDNMLRSLTAKQFMEWQAYAALEPFDEVRADYRMAALKKTLHDFLGPIAYAVGVRDIRTTSKLKDFLLTFGEGEEEKEEQPQRQTWQMKKAIAYAIATAFSGVKRVKDL